MAGKKDTNGTDADPSGLRTAGKAIAEQDAKKAMVQTTFLAGDKHEEHVELEIYVPVSAHEAEMLDRDVANATAKADEKQADLDALVAPRKAEIKALRKEASDKAKESKERKRPVMMRVRIDYYPNTATKRFINPDTGEEVKLFEAMTAAEIERFSLAEAPLTPPDGEPVEAP